MDVTTEQTPKDKLAWAEWFGVAEPNPAEIRHVVDREMEFDPPHLFTGTTEQLLALNNH